MNRTEELSAFVRYKSVMNQWMEGIEKNKKLLEVGGRIERPRRWRRRWRIGTVG